jgi:hypothetical protein
MNNCYSRTLRFLFCAALTVAFSTGAFAQATRTWVSGVGDDANPCSRTAPCKTFAGAISKTAANGEISVLDPGGFGGVTITKGMTLNGTGTLASILAVGQNGVTVNAQPADTIIIRDISIHGANTTIGNGIRYIAGGTVMVDHCWIHGMKGTGSNGRGIAVEKSSDGRLKVIDTVIENNGQQGIFVTTSSGGVSVTVDRTRIMNCAGGGFEAGANNRASISNSVMSDNGVVGIRTSGNNSLVNIDDCVIALSPVGVQASTGSTLRVSDSIIAQNATGVNQNFGTIDSFQGNSLMGNTAPGGFSSTTQKQ